MIVWHVVTRPVVPSAVSYADVRRRPDANQIAQLAIHFSYNQTFIPVQGSMVLVVAPAPDRQSADPSTYAFDYDHVLIVE